ncbi:bifunctional MaoC family dehydratase N-terminal/OB-fold nucleic acid binding domain-containing protein [Streptomyces rimosus]|uniref:bifunctional MaoC family dehydratase N-terminal/OB-fold nucleic acid binding domain-containing protein n=1 Tax=Streptomyces rimosus TaxID=1927 RepID=UPI0031D49883
MGVAEEASSRRESGAPERPAPEGRPDLDDLHARLKAFEGQPAVTGGTGKDPVNEAMIRHWCEAMGDGNPAYEGPDAVAPPTMLQAWTMGGLSGHGRPGSGSGRSSAYDALFALLDEAGCTSVVATDCEQEYLRPLRPGDRITFDAVIESVSPRKTTKLGTGYFVTTRMDVRTDGELAGTHRFRILKYVPASTRSVPRPHPQPQPHPHPRTQPPSHPRPVINRDNAGFWAGVADRKLLIQRCTHCATLRFPWLPGCNHCGGDGWDTVEATGHGTVFSYVVMHHPPFPAFDPPYAVGLIELAEGVRMVAGVVGVPPEKVRIGMPVRLEFRTVEEDLVLPVFHGDQVGDLGHGDPAEDPIHGGQAEDLIHESQSGDLDGRQP